MSRFRMQQIAASVSLGVCLICGTIGLPAASSAALPAKQRATAATLQHSYADRFALLQAMSANIGIPWHWLAAVDQYERALSMARPKVRPLRDGLIAVWYSEQDWTGALNPDPNDTDPASISFFGGIGMDGNGDGIADRTNDTDALYTIATRLNRFGPSDDDIRLALWEYYHNTRSVQRITQFAEIYHTFGTLDLFEHAFPVPLHSDYTYRDTWGASRGWGGLRIHEGTDLFAGYGVPVRSTCYGIIEVRGWNPYGGWRIGIRDLNGVYHYYAHLSGFNKKVGLGDVVKPGQVVGWVGSSGYGKPGTQGRFPPHLHYGLYRDHGLSEWSFDPYPYLHKWEREERSRTKAKH